MAKTWSELSEEEKACLLDYNLGKFFRLAGKALRFCRLCDWPLDEWQSPDSQLPDNRCSVCANMESHLHARQYWRDLEAYDAKRRREMGLQ